jgi:hypothetical protein
MWPAGISAMLLIAFYQVRYNLQEGWFNLALYEFGIMNILFFLVWIRMDKKIIIIKVAIKGE